MAKNYYYYCFLLIGVVVLLFVGAMAAALKVDHRPQQSRSIVGRRQDGIVYQKLIACDSSVMVLKCPNGTSVKVLSAIYGRSDNKTCIKWHHQQDPTTTPRFVSTSSSKPTTVIAANESLPLTGSNSTTFSYSGARRVASFQPCFRNEIDTVRRQCANDAGSRQDCVIFVDHKYQFSEPYCPDLLASVTPGHSRYAAIEFTCIGEATATPAAATNKSSSSAKSSNRTTIPTVYPVGFVLEKGSDKLSHLLASKILGKASILTYNRQSACIQRLPDVDSNSSEVVTVVDNKKDNNNSSRNSAKRNSDKKAQQPKVYCVSLEGVRLKNVRHLISLKRKSNCNDIYIIGGTEIKNNEHLNKVSGLDDGGPLRKRSHRNGYRLDIAASDPSSYLGNNAGMCVSAYIRRNFHKLSPATDNSGASSPVSYTERDRKQMQSWKQQQKHVFNDTSETGGVIYSFIAKPIPIWDILYP